MKSLLHEPLVQFLLIGAVLFLVFDLFNDPVGPQSNRIVIKPGQIRFLKANFTRTWQREPTKQELQGLTDSYVRDEIFYREALELGLDRDDGVIRRRLRQKLEFISDDLAGVAVPSDAQLQQFLETHPESFQSEPQVAFRHIYLNIDQRSNRIMDDTKRLLTQLSGAENKIDPDSLGDSLMLQKSFGLSSMSEISRMFGESFSIDIMKVKPGQWTGPIRSGYGLHLVLVSQHVTGRLPELEEIREVVEREWSAAYRKELKENIYDKLREKYIVVFEQPTSEEKSLPAVSEAQAGRGQQK